MFKKVWNVISIILVCALVILAVLFGGVRLFGVHPYAVLSGSMSPAYPTGALIYVKPAQAEEVAVGDPITFILEDGMVVATHRVVSIDHENSCFETKGDANDTPDGQPVYFDHLIGIPVFSIPLLGYLSNFISQPPGLYLTAAAALTIVLLLILPGLRRKTHECCDEEMMSRTGKKGAISGTPAGQASRISLPREKALRNCKE